MFDPSPTPALSDLKPRLRRLLSNNRPTSVLNNIGVDVPDSLVAIQTEALMDLDQYPQASQLLSVRMSHLAGDDLAEAQCLWVQVALRDGKIDRAILTTRQIIKSSNSEEVRAIALAGSALGYAQKRCWLSAEAAIHQAMEIAPLHPRVFAALGRLRLEGDQRIEARQVYERMHDLPQIWARVHSGWGKSYVAYLLGEFDLAWEIAQSTLALSPEGISPLFVMTQVALVHNDLTALQEVHSELTKRSPKAESLLHLKKEMEGLESQQSSMAQLTSKRLHAFPTIAQRRDYCGPSTVELVLRYWNNELAISSDQISDLVKNPLAGTPIYRIRDFFHLVGFDTIRTQASPEKLKQLIDAGFPAIIQEEFSNNSHVVVVIGYDDALGVMELQDPMTHAVVNIPYEELNRLRKNYQDSAVIAFPHRSGLKERLARMEVFDHPALIWTDQAIQELDLNRPETAIELIERAVRRLPGYGFAWIMLLYASLELWRRSHHGEVAQSTHPDPPEVKASVDSQIAKRHFYSHLARARKNHPEAEFIYNFEGNAALLENDLPRALAAFQKAGQLDPEDARNQASLAGCFFVLRQPQLAIEAARRALEIDSAQPDANAWMGRALGALQNEDSDYYARAALELNPDGWLSHAVMAEIYARGRQEEFAFTHLEQALVLSPENPEILALRADLYTTLGNYNLAEQDLNHLLNLPFPLNPSVQYQVLKSLCQVSFSKNRTHQAMEHANNLLTQFPGDPWGLQFYAAVTCEVFLHTQELERDEMVAHLHTCYEQALEANYYEIDIIRDYIHYASLIEGWEASLEIVRRLIDLSPHQGPLVFIYGKILAQIGQVEQAAVEVFRALTMVKAIRDREELATAMKILVQGFGADGAVESLRSLSTEDRNLPMGEWERSLGLVLAEAGGETQEQAYRLLSGALERDPDDAQVLFHLSTVTLNDDEREYHLRKVLIVNPAWVEARQFLAEHLIEHNRPSEALELTRGIYKEIVWIKEVHARALYALGYYEQAASLYAQINSDDNAPQEEFLLNQWKAELSSGRFDAALNTARKSSRIFKRDPRWMMRVSIALRELGRLDDARQTLERALSHGLREEDALEQEIELSLVSQDYASALDGLGIYLNTVVDNRSGRLSWAEIRILEVYTLQGRFDEIQAWLSTSNLTSDGWGEAAEITLAAGATELALQLTNRSLALEAQNLSGLLVRARVLEASGDETLADANFNQLRQLYPEDHNAYEHQALKAIQDGIYEIALGLADRALELGAFCSRAWAVHGLAHYFNRQPDEARFDLEAAWNRCNPRQREQMAVFWGVLYMLKAKSPLAQVWIGKAEQSNDMKNRRILARLRSFLHDAAV